MRSLKATGLPILLVAAALAGCAGGSSSCADPICVTPAGDGKTFSFTSGLQADNYTWDFGDNLGYASGRDATYTYDVANAKVTPRLVVTGGGESRRHDYKAGIVLGTGQNQAASFVLEAQTDWAVTGERVRFSAGLSTDPDGDTTRYAWSCVAEPLPPENFHQDSNTLPKFKEPVSGSVVAVRANRTLPDPDLSIDAAQDLCASLGSFGSQRLSAKATTLEGTFLAPGKYTIVLVAADPAHPPVSGSIMLVVTPPDKRPPPFVSFTFTGTLTVGTPVAGQPLQPTCSQLDPPQTCDSMSHPFELPIGGSRGWLNLSYELGGAGAQAPANEVTCTLWRGLDVGTQVGPGSHEVPATKLPKAAYEINCRATRGVNVAYQVDFQAHLNVDPATLYF